MTGLHFLSPRGSARPFLAAGSDIRSPLAPVVGGGLWFEGGRIPWYVETRLNLYGRDDRSVAQLWMGVIW